MNNNRIEQALSRALEEAPMITFEELAAAPYVRMTEHDYITRQETSPKAHIGWRYAFATALCILLLTPAVGWFYMNRLPDSTIMLDVNPSLSIITNRYNKVISVVGLNEDAKELLKNPDYKDSELENTVLEILDDLVNESYLTTDKNTILVTVIQKNSQKAEALRTLIDLTIQDGLKARNITPVILSQKIKREAKRSDLAGRYHISEGKLKLIQEILSVNESYSEEELALMSMEALLALAKKNSVDLNSYNLRDYNEETTGAGAESRSEDMEQEDQDDPEDQEDKDGRETDEDENSDDQDGEDLDEEDQDGEDRNKQDQDGEDRDDEDRDEQDQNGKDQGVEDRDAGDQGEEDQNSEGQDEDNQDQNDRDIENNDGEDSQNSEDTENVNQNEENRTEVGNPDNEDQNVQTEDDRDTQASSDVSGAEVKDETKKDTSDWSENSGEGDQGDDSEDGSYSGDSQESGDED